MKLQPYPTYKDSGVPWLGDVPAHWEVLPNRTIFSERIAKGYASEPLLSVTIRQGIIRQESLLTDTSKKDSSNDDKSNYKLVESGDIAYNKMRAWQGAIGLSEFRGIVSPAYVVIRPQVQLHPRYYHYLYRTPAFAKEAERWSYGITSDQWSLRYKDFKAIYSLLPPLPEQHAIARFLDHIDRRVNRYVRAKRQLIALLNEQKQAIIHHAVTRGLDPDASLKPSGVEWLGDIPAHWEVVRLKYVGVVQTGITLGKNYGVTDKLSEYPYLRVANVQDGFLNLGSIKTISLPSQEAATSMLQAGDVLMTEGGDIDKLGRGYTWQNEIPGCLHQNHIFAVRAYQNRLRPEYLAVLMTSKHGRNYFQHTAKQTTNLASTNSTTLRAFPMPLPQIEEQESILIWIKEATKTLDDASRRAISQIDLIREYRTRLISDVVTGKVDVRATVAALPDEWPGDEIGEPDSYDGESAEEPEEELEAAFDGD